MASDEFQIFTSLSALQQASDLLIKSLPEDETSTPSSDRELISARIAQFIDKATASGSILDTTADRKAAQALIDFWLAKSHAFPRENRVKQSTSTRLSTLLRPFDTVVVRSAVERGDALLLRLEEEDDRNRDPVSYTALRVRRLLADGINYVSGIVHWAQRKFHVSDFDHLRSAIDFRSSEKKVAALYVGALHRLIVKVSQLLEPLATIRQKLSPRILAGMRERSARRREIARLLMLRTIHMADVGRSYQPVSVNRKQLLALGGKDQVNQVLGGLIAANVLRATCEEPPDEISLRYEALTREWGKFRCWIDQRISFRDAASFWNRTLRAKGALLPGRLAERALADYADLNALEQAFIAASSSHSRRRMVGLFVACAVLLVVFGVVLKGYYDESVSERREADAATEVIVANSTTDDLRKEQSIRKLASYGKPLKFQSQLLHSLDLNNIYADASSPAVVEIIRSTLQDVKLQNAILPYASFSQSELQGVDFSSAELTSARFDEAVIASTKFSGAKLYRAIFDRTRLIKVDFSDTDLRSTSFRNVRLKDKLVFTRTAWWLALGWTLPQIEQLAADYKDFKVNESKVFRDDISARQKKLGETSVPEDRLQALNELAWTYAIYGTNLDEAIRYSKSALDQIKATSGKSETWTANNSANFSDTMAYISLQQGHIAEAVELLTPGIDASPDGGSMFRYAVALHALAQEKADATEKAQLEQKAIAYLVSSLGNRNYVPSHELYLLRGYITDKFKDKLAAALRGDPG